MTKNFTFRALIICSAISFIYASTALASSEEGSFASAQTSWYRNEFVDIENTDRGVSTSVNMDELRGAKSIAATIDELFSLYDASRFDDALQKINELNKRLRNAEPPQQQSLATSLDFKGVILQRKGELLLAVEAHNEALKLLEQLSLASTSQGLAVRNNLAVVKYLLGDYEASEKLLTDIIKNTGVKPAARARARNNRGLIYTDVGQTDKAIVDFSHAEDEARSDNSLQLLAQILNNEARGWAKQNNQTKALNAFTEALKLAIQVKDIALEADILDSWGEMLVDTGDFNAALSKLTAAKNAEEKANAPLVRVSILKNHARSLAGLQKSEEALQTYSTAFDLAEQMELRALMRDILAERGNLHATLKNLDLAVEDYSAAIELAEKTRERLVGESETGFIEATSHLYREMILLLLKRKADGDTEKAFAMLERSQSALLQEQMATETPELRDHQAMQDINGARGVLRQEAALTKKLQTALSASNPNQTDITTLRKQLAAARKEAVRALGELSDKYKGRYDHFIPAAIDPKYLRDIATHLPAQSLLVTYSFGDDGLYIFLASKDGKIEFRQNLSVTRAELERKIEEYRVLVTKVPGKSREDWRIDSWSDAKWLPLRDATVWLYQQLLAPIADRFQNVNQLIFAPTGQMYYLPFHALGPIDSTGQKIQYLALSQKVSYVAPGSLLKAFDAEKQSQSLKKQNSKILALGDVQFGESTNLDLLPSSKDELKAVKTIFGANALLLEGQNATKRSLLAALNTNLKQTARATNSKFNFVLLSTHGILNARAPRSSYLALENDQRLTAQEIGSLDLRGVSVVTLSACETGLAGKNPGADLMSLGEYISLAGASAVMASLWKVDDFQTAHLMQEFFTHLKKDANSKTAALQSAQIALATHPESTHPFFWSPFVLYGKGWQ